MFVKENPDRAKNIERVLGLSEEICFPVRETEREREREREIEREIERDRERDGERETERERLIYSRCSLKFRKIIHRKTPVYRSLFNLLSCEFCDISKSL